MQNKQIAFDPKKSGNFLLEFEGARIYYRWSRADIRSFRPAIQRSDFLIDDHKTQTIRYAYEKYIEFSYDQHKKWLKTNEVPECERKIIDSMWSRLMQNGAEGFFLDEAAVPEDEIDFEIANFFVWTYKRDGWTTFRPYWQILRVTWKNYRAMGLDLYFENAEDYSVQKR